MKYTDVNDNLKGDNFDSAVPLWSEKPYFFVDFRSHFFFFSDVFRSLNILAMAGSIAGSSFFTTAQTIL